MTKRTLRAVVGIGAAVTLVGALGAAPAYAAGVSDEDAATTGHDVAVSGSAGHNGRNGSVHTIGDQTTGSAGDSGDGKDAMPDNPTQKLPNQVSAAVPDDATVVAPDLATKSDGETVNIETGAKVTDPKIVGGQGQPQPDPLAKTNGHKFIPVQADEVKQAVRENGGDASAKTSDNTDSTDANTGTDTSKQDTPQGQNRQSAPQGSTPDSSSTGSTGNNAQSAQNNPSASNDAGADAQSGASATETNGHVHSAASTGHRASGTHMTSHADTTRPTVRNARLQNNQYGAYWGTYNGTQAFFEADGNLFAQQAKGVIDVSSWQGTIDWQAVKNSGVEGAIIRISYGWDNYADSQAQRNISECKRLGIPFGVYVYSYAANSGDGVSEGRDVVKWLRNFGVSPQNLSYPVFYDLENWTDGGRVRPTSPNVYDGIVNSWYGQLQAAGYNNLSVYSYTYYLNTALNSGNIHSKTRWVASYGAHTGFNYPTNERGWQYADNGSIAGISGNVDLNAFGNKSYVSNAPSMWGYRATGIASGKYYISSGARDSAGLDIPAASKANNARIQLYSANQSGAQQYQLTKFADNSYEIRNVNSGKALDVPAANAYLGAPVQQYDPNGSAAQRWYLRDTGHGGMTIQSKLGNWVLDLPAGNTANNTQLRLWEPNFSSAQQFIFATVSSLPGGAQRVSSVVNDNEVFDMPAASTADGARLQVYQWNNTDAQKYTFRQVGNAIYEIVNVHSGKAIDLTAADIRNNTKIDQYSRNNTCAQHWAVRELSRGQYAFYSACSADSDIDLPAAIANNASGLQLYASNSTNAQRWTLSPVRTARDDLNALAASHRGDLQDGNYIFDSANSTSMALDVAAASQSNNASVRLWSDNGTGAQRWRVQHDGAGYVTLVNVNSGKVLDVPAAQDAPNVAVQQYQSNGTYAQKWIAVRSGNTVKLISAMDKSLVLDVRAAGTADGTAVQLYTDNGTKAQRWVSNRR